MRQTITKDQLIDRLRKHVYNLHDVECNQKYARKYPYSMHLGFVESQFNKYKSLIPNINIRYIVQCAIILHDSIEDARLTYNDVIDLCIRIVGFTTEEATMVADIVYAVTDEKGKNRTERKNEKFYKELQANKLAVFTKLCDMIANKLFSKLTNSSMYVKYNKELPDFNKKVFYAEYNEMFLDLNSI